MKGVLYIDFGIADYSPIEKEFKTMFNSVANIISQMYSSFLREVEYTQNVKRYQLLYLIIVMKLIILVGKTLFVEL